MMFQKIQRIVIPLAALAALILGYRHYGWPGVALVGGGLIMWQLLHFRFMSYDRKNTARQFGWCSNNIGEDSFNDAVRHGITLS